MPCIGVDLGTNSVRAALFDGKALGRGTGDDDRPNFGRVHQHPIAIGYPGRLAAEQNPRDWYESAAQCIREAAQDSVSPVDAISFSTQGGCLLAVDGAGNPLMNAISWLDARADDQARRMLEARSPREWARVTGMVPDANSFLCHLLWLKENRPDVFGKAAMFMTASDYLNLMLTSRRSAPDRSSARDNAVTDPTNAQMTGMFDIRAGRWDTLSMEVVGISERKLPGILPTGAVVGRLSANAARDTGLPEGTPVRNGAHDQYACAIGCGAVEPSDAMLSCGTAWVLLAATKELPTAADTALTVGFHAMPERYGAFYSVSAGCQTLNWTLALTGLDSSPAEVDRVCARRLTANPDVLLYPFIAGGSPLDGGRFCRGVFGGLRLDVDKYDLALAAMESVVFEIARALPAFERSGIPVTSVRMVGGAARSDLWARILASVTGLEVYRAEQSEGALAGAALLASGRPMEGRSHTRPVEPPSRELREFYQDKYRRYLAGLPYAFAVSEQTAGNVLLPGVK